MFLLFFFAVLTIAGNVVSGSVSFAATNLTHAVSSTDSTIYVTSTEGFPSCGIITIENEQIAYSGKSATTFHGNLFRPLSRGASGTTATAHAISAVVRTQEGGIFNASTSYSIATLSDSSGLQWFISAPIAFFQMLGSLLFVPLDFLGTDLSILTYLWAIVGIGFIISLTVQTGGGRRV